MSQESRTSAQPRLWTGSFIAIIVVNLLIFCGFYMLTSTIALYAESLGSSEALMGLVAASTTIAAILVRPFVGIALDRYGRKGLFLVGIIGLGITTIAIPVFPVIAAIMALRTVQGVAWGIASTSASTVAADLIPKERFGEGVGFFGLSNGIAMSFAPALALTLYHGSGGMRLMTIVAAATLFAAFLIALTLKYRKMPAREKGGGRRGETDGDGAILSGDTASVPPPVNANKPSILSKLFERTAVLPAVMIFFCLCGYGAIQSFIAVYVEHLGVGGVELFFVALSVAMLVSRPLFGRLVDQRGYTIPVTSGLILLVVSFILISRIDSTLMLVICAAVFGTGFGAVTPSLQTMAIANVEPDRRGVATSTFFVGFDGGIGIGTIVMGMVAGVVGYANMYLIAAVLPLIPAALYIAFGRKIKRS